jgi:DNA-binding NarL/FixJ family response regulator
VLQRLALHKLGGMDGRSRTFRALIADDTPLISHRLKSALSELDVEVVGLASDSDEAIKLFDEHEPEIAIVDLRMPGSGGLDVVKTFRRRNPTALLIVLTISDSPEFEARSREAGADHFLDKRSGFTAIPEIIRSFGSSFRAG